MNEKLKTILLSLTTEPLTVVQAELVKLQQEKLPTLQTWEKTLIARVKSCKTIIAVFNGLFLETKDKESEQKTISNQLIKPLFLAQAKLPSTSRDSSFYTFIPTAMQQHRWGRSVYENNNESWLANVLIEIDFETLRTILAQTSQDEFNFLFNDLKTSTPPEQFEAWLKKLPVSVWNVFLSKLSLQELEKINLSLIMKDSLPARQSFAKYLAQESPNKKQLWEWVQKLEGIDLSLIIKDSLPACQSLADYLISEGPKNKALWEWVQKKQLLAIPALLDSLAVARDKKSSPNFDAFCSKYKQCKKTPRELWADVFQPLLDPFDQPQIQTFNLREQMIAYGLLAIHLGTLELQLGNHQQGGLSEQNRDTAKTTLEGYRNKSPFLATLFAAQVFPDELVYNSLRAHTFFNDGEIKGHLQLAKCLPTGKQAEQLKNLQKQPKPSSSSSEQNVRDPVPVPVNGRYQGHNAQPVDQDDDDALIAAAMRASLQDPLHDPDDQLVDAAVRASRQDPFPNAADNENDFAFANNEGDLGFISANDIELATVVELSLKGHKDHDFDYKANPKIVAAIVGLFSLALILTLCFTVGAPLWLIPIITFAGVLIGGGVTVIFNNYHQPPRPPTYDPSAWNNYGYDKGDFPSTPTNASAKVKNDALDFSQDDLLQKNTKTSKNDNDNDNDNDETLLNTPPSKNIFNKSH